MDPRSAIDVSDALSVALSRAWVGWSRELLPESLLEPLEDVGVLRDGALLAQLSASEVARLFLCTCKKLQQRLSTADSLLYGLFIHRRVGFGSTAFEVSARCRHEWRENFAGEARSSSIGQRGLFWLDKLERLAYFEDMQGEILGSYDALTPSLPAQQQPLPRRKAAGSASSGAVTASWPPTTAGCRAWRTPRS